MSEKLYSVSVETWRNERIVWITGERTTVIEAALRAILDCAPAWNPGYGVPQFRVAVQEFKK